jgi:hypothetical protein
MNDQNFTPPARDRNVGAPTQPGSPPPEHQPPPGAHAMNVLRWVLFAGLLVLAIVSVGGYIVSMRQTSASGRSQKRRAHARCIRPTPPIARASARSAA